MVEFEPSEQQLEYCRFQEADKEKYIELLDELKNILIVNAFARDISEEITTIKNEINRLANMSKFTDEVTAVVKKHKENMDQKLALTNQEGQNRNISREKLIDLIDKYLHQISIFDKELKYISNYNVKCKTREIVVRGHKLSIENSFELTPDIICDSINSLLKSDKKICDFQSIKPEMLFQCNFKGQVPKVKDYDDFINRLYDRISGLNKRKYKILTADGQDFDKLSPGWKSAVILDLILGYEGDTAPIIIDQPEDNLATNYINRNLIQLIKDVKYRKQIILVSHNATIPMLGDAQNIVLCRNDKGRIKICSQPLEGNVDSKSIVDYIAEITDGGKSSIKKRVKKYNLKSFKENEE